jgi:2-isopropylmalate synthase
MGLIGDNYERWEVPYLPIDPKHTGRTYEEIIRVNSQSGKGGVSYLMDQEYGLNLPRQLQIEFSRHVQKVADTSGSEIKPDALWDLFEETYLSPTAQLQLLSTEVVTGSGRTSVVAQLKVEDSHVTVKGEGNGPIAALVAGLQEALGITIEVMDYSEHALAGGSGASAVAYVQVAGTDGAVWWGVGMDSSILDASLRAVISAANRIG